MIRGIKFRAWDKKTNKMYPVDSLAWDSSGNLEEVWLAGVEPTDDETSAGVRTPDEVILEQSTGSFDRNGEEICDGDIVLDYYDGEDVFIVEWDKDTASFILTGTDHIASVSFDNFYSDKDLEIIGNIHENLELLGGEE